MHSFDFTYYFSFWFIWQFVSEQVLFVSSLCNINYLEMKVFVSKAYSFKNISKIYVGNTS